MTSDVDANAGEALLVRQEDNVLWLTLNRPKSMNAMTPEMPEALGAALRIVGPDDARQGPISVGHQGATDGQGPLNLSLLHSR